MVIQGFKTKGNSYAASLCEMTLPMSQGFGKTGPMVYFGAPETRGRRNQNESDKTYLLCDFNFHKLVVFSIA